LQSLTSNHNAPYIGGLDGVHYDQNLVFLNHLFGSDFLWQLVFVILSR